MGLKLGAGTPPDTGQANQANGWKSSPNRCGCQSCVLDDCRARDLAVRPGKTDGAFLVPHRLLPSSAVKR